ncbi:MAG: N-acetyl-gamma-glutamyl-phosphate reductase [Deltaproteobacteria bacterium]|nr:N-acetyl-gamma-glutamyl-phosphate reductase [Deltaproteobacteria bacterium]
MALAKRFKAAVIGGSGYGGAELIRRLIQHPDVELVRVASIDFIGEPVSNVHPNLEGVTDLKFEGLSPAEAAQGMDVVLLGLPHKVSAQKVPEIMSTGARIVDLSGDFRLRDPAVYRRYYGADHPAVNLLDGTFVYGLPELNREQIKKAKYVASPGCFATTIELGVLPLAKAGMLTGMIETVGITGSSGAGIVPTATTHHPVRSNNLRTYKPLDHQHIPEILQTLHAAGGKDLQLSFVPVSAPLARGIFATSFVHVDEKIPADEIKRVFAEYYAKEPFVRVPKKRLPEVVAVAGSNYVEVACQPGAVENGRRVVACFSVTDNLIKGGAGQGIQSMNLMLGLDERATLEDPGSWP